MTRPTDERLLAFLEGSLQGAERDELLDALDRDLLLAERLRAAAAGLEALRSYTARADDAGSRLRKSVSPWWVAAAAAATLILAVPATWWIANRPAVPSTGVPTTPGGEALVATGQPTAPDPTFVLVLHGRWPDAGAVEATETQSRAREYWDWTSSLAESGLLVAAGDLRWEPGERLGPAGAPVLVAADEVERPDYVVGMLALRVDSYDEALAIAAECPHLRYGGTVSVRRVGSGFVTVPGEGDWLRR